jgi:hypothetical protein
MGKLRRSARNLLLFLAAFGTAAVAMGAIDGDPASFEFGAYLSSGSLALLSCNWRRFGRWQMAAPRTGPAPRAPQPRYKPGGVVRAPLHESWREYLRG